MKSNSGKIALHVIGSLCFVALPIIFSPDTLSNMFAASGFRRDLITYILLLGVFYTNYFYFVPRYFLARKFGWFVVTTVLSFAMVVVISALLSGPSGPPPERNEQQTQLPPPARMDQDQLYNQQAPPAVGNVDRPHQPGRDRPPLLHQIERNLFRFAIVLAIAILLRVSGRLKQAQRDKLDAELSYLKAQINPHFLFNTLNSIYSLAITRSDLTATSILKLSEMMRYVTTEAHSELVALEKEINYVSNYIELQRIRLGQTVRIEYSVTGEAGQKKIAPLLLIPFVENAFKYGVNPEEEGIVTVKIEITQQLLKMFVGNKIVTIDYLDEYKSGHGMNNVSQRLQMGYPGKHKLNVVREENAYKVNLEIEL